ncbi:peroxyureidoacrylate/ureidoacrylate amidohydrolase RutB [Variibacter gotjawalensis]|uniref:Peroxyureidoacrylate/ureidoacrylate amidohydrolase RutB n=1 Tax=Variibacter gotjawalensis TaxID=1333996 RepID=A0A0S3PPV2_9BRAD|nr:cysteine hydrolase [Variibacter gotjawalensis]NIK48087.1 nicotinamidase-related amidase [Variibacter gotjawalensis]RZS49963.1 nicotinamidase-related amidase [Variibacter gotjawalensis]BAT57790.1 peroxyureidoacrylate/ureidoacrylate amidohydrolase RutB [Variibacter gotjawalensis]
MKKINGLDIPQTLEDVCDPRRMALLVYDMQVGICSQVKSGPHITAQTATVLAAARQAEMRVVFTRHLSMPKSWMGITQFRTAMAWQRKDEPDDVHPWFLRDTPGFEIVPELAPRAGEAVLDKLAFSAFEGTPLEFALRDCGILAIAIVGIATEIGIAPTASHAADLGFIPVIIADACGAGHEEAGQRALKHLEFMGDTMVSDTATFTRLLGA